MHVQVDFTPTEDRNCLFFAPVPGRVIKRSSFPTPEEMRGRLQWQACPGERLAILVAARTLEKEELFAYEMSDWTSENGNRIAAAFFDIRMLSYKEAEKSHIPLDYLHYPSFGDAAAEQPDRLIVSKQWKIPAKQCSLMWIIAKIPEGTVPDKYRSTLKLSDAVSLPLELEVLPVKLLKSERIYGLWTNSLPGSDAEARNRQCHDLREHGINTFFLDPWTVPVKLNADGSPNLQRFREALQWLKKEDMNQKILIYGVLEPLLKAIEERAGPADPENATWRELAGKIFRPMQELAAKEGFDFYLHPYDEPDVHPKITASFTQLCQALKSIPGLKVASNVSASGQRHFGRLLDVNICNSGYPALACRLRTAIHFSRSGEPLSQHGSKKTSGMPTPRCAPTMGEAPDCFMVWRRMPQTLGAFGLCLPLEPKDWYIAWPYPEENVASGSTYAWELLSAGIEDTRYWLTLKKLRPDIQLPQVKTLLNVSAEELAEWRQEMTLALQRDGYQPRLMSAKTVNAPYEPKIVPGQPHLTAGLKPIEIKNYEVYPGNIYKLYWNRADRDWLDAGDAQKRLGLLTQKTDKPLTQTPLCYNFWRAAPAESYIAILAELNEETEVAAVKVDGLNHSKMYMVSHAELRGSPDAMSFTPATAAFGVDAEPKGATWSITMPGCGQAKYILLTVWTGGNNYLNITRIAAFKKAANQSERTDQTD